MAEAAPRPAATPVLEIRDLWVQYGQVPALQGVELSLDRGVLAIVGRNGMGKTTLCNAVTGLVRASRGSIRFAGVELTGLAANEIAGAGSAMSRRGGACGRPSRSTSICGWRRAAGAAPPGPCSASTRCSRA